MAFELYNRNIQQAIQNIGLYQSIHQCTKVVLKGTEYKRGQVLVIGQGGYRYEIIMGKICMILCHEKNIYVLYEILENQFIAHLNTYEIGRTTSYECRRLYNVLDFKPLHIYNIGSLLCVKPWHGFVSKHV